MSYERYVQKKDYLCSMPPLVEVGGYGGPWGWFIKSIIGKYAVFGSSGNGIQTSIFTYANNSAVAGGNLSYAANNIVACSTNPGVNS
jgi:hypothetical protein